MKSRLRSLPFAVTILMAALPLAVGCSSAVYDDAYGKAVAAARTRSEFAKLQKEPIELAGGRVRMQPPRLLPDWLHDKAADPRVKPKDSGEPPVVDPRRLFPPFLKGYPGFTAAYEGAFENGNAELPVTLSIGAVPPSELSEPQIAAQFVEQFKREEAFSEANPKWESREVVDKNGATRSWRVLRLQGPQAIDRWVAGIDEYKPIDATCEIWLSADRDQPFCTVLTWRVPDELVEKVGLDELAPLVARSVVVLP